MSLNRYTGGFSRPMYNLNASPHIFFTKPDDRDYHNFESYLFRAGAGDFLLMSRKLWDAIGGFHEMKFNTHVDNLLNLKMFKLITGFPKMFLPYTIIHQEHPHINPVYGTIDSILNVFLQYLPLLPVLYF